MGKLPFLWPQLQRSFNHSGFLCIRAQDCRECKLRAQSRVSTQRSGGHFSPASSLFPNSSLTEQQLHVKEGLSVLLQRGYHPFWGCKPEGVDPES